MNKWTREELILTFNLYCKIPFGKYSQGTIEVVQLAELIGRTPSAVAFKLGNFASFDPYHQRRGVKGWSNSSKLDREIYNEFSTNWDELIYESEDLLSRKLGKGPLIDLVINDSSLLKEGKDVLRLSKTRVNQSFFRKVVVQIYSNTCAVSNIDIPELLIASHIVPWSHNKKERLNPSNGICLSAHYDKAFDKGLMTLTDNLEIKFSRSLLKHTGKVYYEKFFECYEGNGLNLPEKFHPKQEFVSYHRDNIFIN